MLDTSGWVVELQRDVWLLNSDPYDPSRCTKLQNATRWPTEKAAKRAMNRVRNYCHRKFHGFKIYRVEE